MFCPECKAEYRPGFTHCNDCDVDLVEELPEAGDAPTDSPARADSVVAWTGPDEGECAAICDRLEEADIAFEVAPHANDFFYGGQSQHLEIRVPTDALEHTQQILGEFAQEAVDRDSGEGESQELKSLELPDEDDDGGASIEDGLERDANWDPRNWHPEDATEQIWSGDDPKQADMIELSLRELHIHTRTDTLDDGSQQIFVMAEQEARAREIVRQIIEGTPLP